MPQPSSQADPSLPELVFRAEQLRLVRSLRGELLRQLGEQVVTPGKMRIAGIRHRPERNAAGGFEQSQFFGALVKELAEFTEIPASGLLGALFPAPDREGIDAQRIRYIFLAPAARFAVLAQALISWHEITATFLPVEQCRKRKTRADLSHSVCGFCPQTVSRNITAEKSFECISISI